MCINFETNVRKVWNVTPKDVNTGLVTSVRCHPGPFRSFFQLFLVTSEEIEIIDLQDKTLSICNTSQLINNIVFIKQPGNLKFKELGSQIKNKVRQNN